MPVVNLGFSAPINPPGATPILTPSQVWTGLCAKVRHANLFVPLITACEVLSEDSSNPDEPVVTRRVTFNRTWAATAQGKEVAPGGETVVTEVCRLHEPARIDFEQEDGTRIGNFVTVDKDGGLVMTYVFEWKVKGEVAEETVARFRQVSWVFTAKMAVEGSIDTIRKIVTGEVVIP
ncbi:hypothetical protein C8A05DRAFT_16775 [Staphylotrichum tortipilum]|uniref:DUF1857-domain-containing protein n=1 Tax=Staphylotrichum tortipilum TaxID=2831512 RepID=A0AAN6RRR9_9PEZI|nr:hypothetical protein C8A05DRAFT_16775 [Staphylotrichum longicolle]